MELCGLRSPMIKLNHQENSYLLFYYLQTFAITYSVSVKTKKDSISFDKRDLLPGNIMEVRSAVTKLIKWRAW